MMDPANMQAMQQLQQAAAQLQQAGLLPYVSSGSSCRLRI
jgi:N-acetylmuramic acid 6-phosphate (MurNAc-6-P) etherase